MNVSQGQSNIKYFTTKPDTPTCPIVETLSKTNQSITLNWYPAIYEREEITSYKVDIFIQPEHDYLNSRDYCAFPRVDPIHVSVGVEVGDGSGGTFTQTCAKDYDDWRVYHPDSMDPEYEWRVYRKAICSKQSSRTGVWQKPLSIGDLFRYKRGIHEYVMINSNQSDTQLQPRIRTKRQDGKFDLGSNYIGAIMFPDTASNATISGLRPYTLYTFQFFSCNSISCSSFFIHSDRTDSSSFADDMKFTIDIDPNDSNRVYLDFSAPETPNGVTVAFQIEKHDLANFNITTTCITRKQHDANGKRYGQNPII